MRTLILLGVLVTAIAVGKNDKAEPPPAAPKHGGGAGVEFYDANINSSISWGVLDPTDAKPVEGPGVTTVGRQVPTRTGIDYSDKGRPLLQEIEAAKKKEEQKLSEPYMTGVRVGDKDGLASSEYTSDGGLEKLTVDGQTIVRPTKLNGQRLTRADLNYVATRPGTQIPLINGPPIGSPSSPQQG